MSNEVWNARDGWHDGAARGVGVDERGRLESWPLSEEESDEEEAEKEEAEARARILGTEHGIQGAEEWLRYYNASTAKRVEWPEPNLTPSVWRKIDDSLTGDGATSALANAYRSAFRAAVKATIRTKTQA